ncbi:hypothetical protein GQ44DRAFT_823495 [Phaeosphaeriaceae sp. PMI808]|nr:hypothetical protein GQ44DRAFT_823495 [Phaeosphaeriaceae sp. PMI808]
MEVPILLGIFVILQVFVVSAQGVQYMPQCAADCLETNLRTISTCAKDDLVCICTDPRLAAAMQACVGVSCSVKQTLTALNVTDTMCQRPVRDRTHISTVVAGITGGSAVLAVILRTIDVLVDGQFGWDDACTLAAGIWVIPMNAVQFPIGPAGFGRDAWTVPFENLVLIQKMVWLTQIFYWPTTALTKLAFLLLYLRIFPQEKLRKYIYTTMALTFCYWAFFQFSNIFYCRPMTMVWEGWDGEHEGSCWDINLLMLAAAGVTVILDCVIIVLPIREIMQLSLSFQKKLGIMAIFTVGIFTLVVSCLRVWKITSYAKSLNPTWDNVPADYWSVLEANVSVLCVCMPALRRFVVRQIPFWRRRCSSNGVAIISQQISEPKSDELRAIRSNAGPGEVSVVAHHPWEELMVCEAVPSRGSLTSLNEGRYLEAAENERIEIYEGMDGKHILLRRGLRLGLENAFESQKLPGLEFPNFEDDD